jgi:hypothetical protein
MKDWNPKEHLGSKSFEYVNYFRCHVFYCSFPKIHLNKQPNSWWLETSYVEAILTFQYILLLAILRVIEEESEGTNKVSQWAQGPFLLEASCSRCETYIWDVSESSRTR